MKRLFVYYSFTGNGKIVSELFEKQGFEIREVHEKAKMPKSFFWGIMAGGFRAGLGLKGKLIDFDDDISSYDEIVIGSPIWNGRFPPATNGMLARLNLADKKVSFVVYSGSGTGKHALKRIQKEFPDAKTIFLQEPKKYPGELEKLKEILGE